MCCVPISDSLIHMEGEPPIPVFEGVSAEDWQRTPASVKQLLVMLMQEVIELKQRVALLEEENHHLREQLASNSGNSSLPPSSDGPAAAPQRPEKHPSGRKRGAQKGHQGHKRKLYPVERCQQVIDHYPQQCCHCGSELTGNDPQPYRHQVVELPPVEPVVEEHRLHSLRCEVCGTETRAKLAKEVAASGYGPRAVATVALLGGIYRASQRLTQRAMAELYGIEMSVGTVNALRQEASEALAEPVEKAHDYVKQQEMVSADETGYKQGDADGANPHGKKAWLWVAVTALVTVFKVSLSRGQEAAQELLGAGFRGVVSSDRWSGYNWLLLSQRQLCWAHLKREFQKLAERGGESGSIGEALLEQTRKLFELWYRVRDGTLSRSEFEHQVRALRQAVKAQLEKGASYQPKKGEKSARAKTARTCKALLKLEPALWLFVSKEGVEPTNNAAERAIRPAVLWRRVSFGSQSAAGGTFVARMLTVVSTLRQQDRDVLGYLTEACQAARQGEAAPSLLPSVAELEDQLPIAA
jgi:transposase